MSGAPWSLVAIRLTGGRTTLGRYAAFEGAVSALDDFRIDPLTHRVSIEHESGEQRCTTHEGERLTADGVCARCPRPRLSADDAFFSGETLNARAWAEATRQQGDPK